MIRFADKRVPMTCFVEISSRFLVSSRTRKKFLFVALEETHSPNGPSLSVSSHTITRTYHTHTDHRARSTQLPVPQVINDQQTREPSGSKVGRQKSRHLSLPRSAHPPREFDFHIIILWSVSQSARQSHRVIDHLGREVRRNASSHSPYDPHHYQASSRRGGTSAVLSQMEIEPGVSPRFDIHARDMLTPTFPIEGRTAEDSRNVTHTFALQNPRTPWGEEKNHRKRSFKSISTQLM